MLTYAAARLQGLHPRRRRHAQESSASHGTQHPLHPHPLMRMLAAAAAPAESAV